ncbi:B3 domain-containing protein At5g60140-like [Tripterygium wilfordii]|uniref:B3 domain-containing protein At5g60140-like n=1 Tax=Tripterygium wilfordii TaxID=458696 RepID=UPI0018F82D58|nr:B3 domain-containing protein At5g60140-like [Tripterygium wilfordii]
MKTTDFRGSQGHPKPHKKMIVRKVIRRSKKFPNFLSIYSQERNFEKMKIPTAFIASIGKVLPDKVILRSWLGRVWHVEVNKEENGVFFLNGWKELVKDNSVEHEDLLVFRYNGDNIFDFSLFGKSKCEKEECEEMEERVPEMEGAERVPEEGEEEDDDNSDHDYGYDVEEEKPFRKRRCREKKGGFRADAGFKAEGSYGKNNTVKTAELKPEKYVHSENPYFITRVRIWMEHLLHIPKDWMKEQKIAIRGKVTYLSPEGRQWPGKVILWNNGRTWIDGWGDFCKANRIRQDDCCICELMQDHRGNILQVHIVRV